MDWRDIPSLAALRAFEAAARTGSLTAAARELNVTHAAIAQHVRTLEADLGVALLHRAGRGMKLTTTGAELANSVSEGFAQIIEGVRDIQRAQDERPLALSVTPSFAENWLMPRMISLWAAHPGFSLSITPDIGLADLTSGECDMAIRYGKGDWDGVDITALTTADFTIAAAPQLLGERSVSRIEDLSDLPWLFETNYRESQRWVEDAGLDFDCCQVNHLATLNMVLAAARAGGGVCVVSSALIQQDVAAGRLISLITQKSDLGYFIVHRKGVISDRMKTLKRWLLSET